MHSGNADAGHCGSEQSREKFDPEDSAQPLPLEFRSARFFKSQVEALQGVLKSRTAVVLCQLNTLSNSRPMNVFQDLMHRR